MSQTVCSGGLVWLAGQVAKTAPNKPVGDQTRDVLKHIDALLAEAGTDKSKLLSATIWLADISKFEEMNAVWDKWVVEGATPARACIEAKLAKQEYTVEIMVVAAK
jgi:enamine deaminase RidA (YjgF/YER057c/UK114 family)